MAKSPYADAFIGAGHATGAAAALGPERRAARAEARTRAEASKQELRRLRATKLSEEDLAGLKDEQTKAIQVLNAKQDQLLRKANERTTYEALRMYDKDPDVRHLNTWLRDLKSTGSKMFTHITRIDEISESDKTLMQQQQFDPDFILNNPDIRQNFVKLTKSDGTQEIQPLDKLKAGTRYNQYATQEELQSMQNRIQLMHVQATGYYDGTPKSVEAFRRAVAEVGSPDAAGFQEAYTKHYDSVEVGRGSNRPENLTEKEAEATRRTRAQGHQEGTPEWDRAFSQNMSAINTEWNRPSRVRGPEAATGAEEALVELDYLDADPTDQKARLMAEPHIRMIEQAGGAELSEGQKTQLMRINELIHLGDITKDITDDETGVIDRVFRSVKKYISDDVEGVNRESAFAAYRNTVRHALYGSTLTTGETSSFKEQISGLGVQRGPLLAQMYTAMSQVQSDLQTIARLNNPWVVKHRLGMSQQELDRVLFAFEERIDMINEAMGNKPIKPDDVTTPVDKEIEGQTILTPERKAGLDALRSSFGDN